MNPNSILARETRLPAQAARRREASRADFQLPEPAADARDRRGLATGDRNDRPAARIDRSRSERADQVQDPRGQGPHGHSMRGGERSREVRRDRDARDDRPGVGEGPERRSARADEVSNRDKTKHLAGDCCEAAAKSEGETLPEQTASAEAAALELLAKAEAGALIGTAPDRTAAIDEPAAEAPSPVEGTATAAGELPAQQPATFPAMPTPVEAKPDTSAEQAESEAMTGQRGAEPQRTTPTHVAAKDGEPTDAATDQMASSPEDAAGSTKAQDKPETSGKAPAEASQTVARPVQEAKAETVQGQPQPAAARFEVLPPGLVGLPDNARALQAQLSEARPPAGAHPHGARGPESAPTSLSALPIEIGFRALEGTKRFDIRLDPAELGRVDVSLSFDKDGEVTAKLTVDRVETLHLLQRDAKTLERAFDQAGLRTSDAGVQISLSDRNAGNGGGFEAEQDRARGAGRRDEAEPVTPAINEIIPQRRLRLGGVDVNI
jgi:flagellar hook-length control protein FliK